MGVFIGKYALLRPHEIISADPVLEGKCET
jgi:hypothetical protein